jgi:uncharacterized phiE125 gp8 family phage protein
MGMTLLVAPSGEPITLAEAKLQCRVDGTDDDTLITGLIVVARKQAESCSAHVLLTQQWRLDLDCFPVDSIDLPLPPLTSVQSITYLDGDGMRQTLAASEYTVIANKTPGVVLPAYGKSWPSCRVTPGSVQISFTAGFGDAAAVPQEIKQWMLLHIDTWYEHRASVSVGPGSGGVAVMPYTDRLLSEYRKKMIGF